MYDCGPRSTVIYPQWSTKQRHRLELEEDEYFGEHHSDDPHTEDDDLEENELVSEDGVFGPLTPIAQSCRADCLNKNTDSLIICRLCI